MHRGCVREGSGGSDAFQGGGVLKTIGPGSCTVHVENNCRVKAVSFPSACNAREPPSMTFVRSAPNRACKRCLSARAWRPPDACPHRAHPAPCPGRGACTLPLKHSGHEWMCA